MVNDEVRAQLAHIVRLHGQGIVDDPIRLQGLLRDVVGQHRREINVLMQALRSNVPGELLKASGPTELTADRLVDSLQQDTGLSRDSAQWAVETWGNALGVPISFGEETTEPSPPAAISQPTPISEPARPQVTTPSPPPIASNPPPSQPHQAPWQPPQPYAPYQQPQKKSSMGVLIAVLVVVVLGGGGALGYVLMKKSDHGDNGPTSSPTISISPTTSPTPTIEPTDNPSPSASESATASPSNQDDPAAIGKLEDGVYSDGWGMFSFSPPSDWDFTPDTHDGSVQWTSSDNKTAMDLRLRPAKAISATMMMKSSLDNLEGGKLRFKEDRQEDFDLGGVAGRIAYGTLPGPPQQDIGFIIVVNGQRAVQLTISAQPGTLAEAAKPLNDAFKTWKWK